MYWQEPSQEKEHKGRANVVDIAFRIRCSCLPVDHAHDLLQAIARVMPWIHDDDMLGIHSIHGAASGNGWYQPMQENGGLMQLSKRVRLILRAPEARLDQCAALCGKTLSVLDQQITVNNYNVRTINPMPALFARSVLTQDKESEDSFIENIHGSLVEMNIDVPKILPGRKHKIKLADRDLVVRSLLLADISIPNSIRLQEVGLGENRKLGCGLFIPHKSISAVEPTA